MYLTRNWEDWEENWAGTGLIDYKYKPGLYWDENETYPEPPCDEGDPDCEQGGGGGGDANPDDEHPAPSEEATADVSSETSRDPNEKVGTAGVGAARFVAAGERLHYVVHFENLGAAPAQVVTIADAVDPALVDAASFSLEAVTVGGRRLEIPDGSATWSVLLDLRPVQALLLRIDAAFAPASGALTWSFRSIDPATWTLPEFDGFLPPNDVPPAGEGSVAYSFRPAAGLPSGTEIGGGAVASIVFDENAPIETGDWRNTVDATAPASAVAPLPAVQASGRFAVAWTAADAESGVGGVALETAEDDGPWRSWLPGAPAPAGFWGNAGRRYAFRSVARDRVGNREAEPVAADASTQVAALDDATSYQATEHAGKTDQLAADCHLTLDDPLFDEAENYAVSKVQRLLLPADDDGLGIAAPEAHFVAYRIAPARQGIRPPAGKCSREAANAKAPCTADAGCPGGVCLARKFVAGGKHRARTGVEIDNRLGDLLLDTKKEQLLLVPATLDLTAPPPAPAAARDHLKCYQANPTKGADSEQAPGGKPRKGMQTLVQDAFGDGAPRLYDLTKPILLCTPNAKTNVDTLETDAGGAHRATSCVVAPAAIGSPVDVLVCYQAKLARTVVDPALAARLGVPVGTRLEPPQPAHVPRAPFVGHQLPRPARLQTKKEAAVCVASDLIRPGS